MKRVLRILSLGSLIFLGGLTTTVADSTVFEFMSFGVEQKSDGPWGPIAIIVLRFLGAISGVIPTSPVLLVAGATEGIVLGSVYVLIGAQLGALTAFLIGRSLGRGLVERKGWIAPLAKTTFGGWLLHEKTSQTRLMAAVFYSRMIPGINLDALSYVAGVTPLATWRFCLATFGALLPYTVLLVAMGQKLVELGHAQFILVLLALLVVGAIPPLWRYLRRSWPTRPPEP